MRLWLEAAHARRRILHAASDATGRELVRTLAAAVRRTPSITILEDTEARRLIVEDGAIAHVLAVARTGVVALPTGRVVLATGGIGGLFCDTTNPPGSIGHGLALAASAGAEFADLEFVRGGSTSSISSCAHAAPALTAPPRIVQSRPITRGVPARG